MRIASCVVAVAGAVVLAAGGASLAVAPSAAAASIPSKCQYQWNTPHQAKATTTVNLRTDPGASYTSLGNLSQGTGIIHYCVAYPSGST